MLKTSKPITLLKENFSSYAVYLFLALMLFLAQMYSPNYLSLTHMMGVLRLSAFMGMAAIGQTIAILSGGIDLSIPHTISFSYILAAEIMNKTDANIPQAFLVMVVLALVIGSINAFGVCVMKIPAFIMTLGVGTVVRGASIIWSKGTPKGYSAPLIRTISNSALFDTIPYIVLVWIVLAVLAVVMLRCTPFGRKIYAVGSNPTAAQFSGINSRAVTFGVYILSALVACITGFFLIGYTGESYLDAGLNYDTAVIAAVILGGTAITGGKGGYLGSAAGSIMMIVFTDFLQIINMSAGMRKAGQGLLILLLIILYARERKVRV